MIASALAKCMQGRCVLVGVGNRLCGDDGFGPCVIERLRGEVEIPLIEAGIAPENYIGVVAQHQPREIVIFDALSLAGEVGSLHWIESGELESAGMSTHGPSLDMFVTYIEQSLGAQMHILGVVPGRTDLGEPMTAAVAQAVDRVVASVLEVARA